MIFSATVVGVTLPSLGPEVRSVDIFFGNDRVWSIDLNELPPLRHGRYVWPEPLRQHLRGQTRIILRESGNEEKLSEADVRFNDEPVVTRVLDNDGVPLAINKWGRLGKTLEAGNTGVQERILDRTEQVIAHLREMNLRPFVVGGTLLGGIREGALLPHDDDADIAYLSAYTNPVDVATEGFEVGRKLVALGYELVRHSATHMQLYFRGSEEQLDYYVDVFTAFFTEDGQINQPFHVRGAFQETQMLPFGTVEIQGRMFPAPADPDSWLVVNYDENWRTPIPGYRLSTPRSTIRRFQNWFGSFHQSRDFWNEYFQKDDAAAFDRWQTGREWILGQESTLRAKWMVDLGSGSGLLGAKLRDAEPNRTVITADYSPYATALQKNQGETRMTAVHVNLFRNLSLAMPTAAGVQGAFDIVANHLLDHLGQHAISQAFRLIRMAVRSGGNAYATLYGRRDLDAPQNLPTSWGIAPVKLAGMAADFGLDVEVVKLKPAKHERDRAPYGVHFTLQYPPIKENQ